MNTPTLTIVDIENEFIVLQTSLQNSERVQLHSSRNLLEFFITSLNDMPPTHDFNNEQVVFKEKIYTLLLFQKSLEFSLSQSKIPWQNILLSQLVNDFKIPTPKKSSQKNFNHLLLSSIALLNLQFCQRFIERGEVPKKEVWEILEHNISITWSRSALLERQFLDLIENLGPLNHRLKHFFHWNDLRKLWLKLKFYQCTRIFFPTEYAYTKESYAILKKLFINWKFMR